MFLVFLLAILFFCILSVWSNFDDYQKKKEHTTNTVIEDLRILDEIKNKAISGTLSEEEFDYIARNDKDLQKLKNNFYK